MKTLIIGDISENLAKFALSVDGEARLIITETDTNCDTGYTSLGDVSLSLFHQLISEADRVILHSPESQWTNDSLKTNTLHCLNLWRHIKIIENLPNQGVSWPDHLEPLVDQRRSSGPQIWVAGCSIANGNGVANNQRFGYLLSQRLELPVSHLTRNGSSISWASDQILRSDIRANDIVIFGLTSISRFFWTDETGVYHINAPVTKKEIPESKSRNTICDLFGTLHQDTLSLNAIRQVQSYSKKIGCQIILADFYLYNLESYLAGTDDYVHLVPRKNYEDRFLDYADDGRHPGPQTHQWFCDILQRMIAL